MKLQSLEVGGIYKWSGKILTKDYYDIHDDLTAFISSLNGAREPKPNELYVFTGQRKNNVTGIIHNQFLYDGRIILIEEKYIFKKINLFTGENDIPFKKHFVVNVINNAVEFIKINLDIK